ncbi:peptidylprolyl isomerase [Taibaiella koreensis]|uniref:peptidylprolyl isomerase n=1 Tax=Taibaiella koreensis TaxID=1268548 RepID=UPI000E59D438|nr:peptidylprolyl isomerase [Taibaiella koreensis]
MRVLFSIAVGVSSVLTVLSVNAQTLFTYGPNAVSKEEFLRVYQKNNVQKKPDFSAKSVNEYVDLYSLFRMKVKEAEQIHLDTTAAVRGELSNYKGQLARTYLSDKEVTKGLVKQAYDRMKEEVKVAHILVAVRPTDDSTRAYHEIDSIYNAIVSKKADFAEMAKQYSEDKGSGAKGGDIGFITALQVVYPFENAAYNTPVGQVSKPFRTQFGFHILKVEERRKNSGQVQVAQIMVATPKSKGAEGVIDARKKIAEVQGLLKSGKAFDQLAKEYSEDKFSKDNGGLMEPFGVGKLMPEFESAAFALKKPGDLSEPIQTEYGIHLVKLVKKIPLQPFDSLQDYITRRVDNDSRAAVAKEAYQVRIKKQFGFKEYPEHLDKLVNDIVAGTEGTKEFKPEDYKSSTETLFELGGKKYTQYNFATYAGGYIRGNIVGNKKATLGDLYKMYQNSVLNDLQQEDLEKSNVEYRNLVTEYRDGILLFDLMDKNVWSKASKDTVGLAGFYKEHQDKYQWQPGFEGTIYQAANEADLLKLQAAINKGTAASDAVEQINTADNPSRISQQTGRFEFSRFHADADAFPQEKPSKIFKNEDGTYTMAMTFKRYPKAESKSLDEARGFVVADYQDYLEKSWNQELRSRYPVKVDEKTMKTIVK